MITITLTDEQERAVASEYLRKQMGLTLLPPASPVRVHRSDGDTTVDEFLLSKVRQAVEVMLPGVEFTSRQVGKAIKAPKGSGRRVARGCYVLLQEGLITKPAKHAKKWVRV